MVFRILIDCPDVVLARPGQDVFGGKHGRHHGVVLIVVSVHAIASNQVQSWEAFLDFAADLVYMPLIAVVVDRISLALPDHAAIDDISTIGEMELADFRGCERNQLGVG